MGFSKYVVQKFFDESLFILVYICLVLLIAIFLIAIGRRRIGGVFFILAFRAQSQGPFLFLPLEKLFLQFHLSPLLRNLVSALLLASRSQCLFCALQYRLRAEVSFLRISFLGGFVISRRLHLLWA